MLNILLTGATGAVGSRVLSELLADGCKVYCIVRSQKGQSAEQRLREITTHPNAIVLEGNIVEAGCGINLRLFRRIDKVVHCAADVRFDNEFAWEIHQTNVIGTENVLALATLLRVPEFHYVSTAYVVGDGVELGEEPVRESLKAGSVRNPYEGSKLAAEARVRGWVSGASRASIYRPSIIIGDSVTGATRTTDGYYGFFEGLWRLKRRSHAEGTLHLPITLRAAGATRLNLVTVDWVGKTMAKLVVLPARGETYNLTHPSPMRVDDVMHASLQTLGITGVEITLTPPKETNNRKVKMVQRVVDAELARYRPYVTHGPRFVSLNAARDLGSDFIPAPIVTPEFLDRTLRYVIDNVWEKKFSRNLVKDGNVVRFRQPITA